ncbi:MAG: DNA polymerase I, partial [Spirochaetales bacterium]|nr:DNA polymerase I [Spirochaetales bacterium]
MEERKKLEEAKDAPATVVAEEPKVFDKKLYILDGYSNIYRSYFAHITSPLTDKEGKNVSAYFGFFSTLFSLLSNYPMDYLAVTMDEKAPTFRHQMYPEYKANRE